MDPAVTEPLAIAAKMLWSQRTRTAGQRVFGEQRGRLVVERRASREHPLDDPSIDIVRTGGEVEVDHVGGVPDDAADDRVDLDCRAQPRGAGEAGGGDVEIVGEHHQLHPGASVERRLPGGECTHDGDRRAAQDHPSLAGVVMAGTGAERRGDQRIDFPLGFEDVAELVDDDRNPPAGAESYQRGERFVPVGQRHPSYPEMLAQGAPEPFELHGRLDSGRFEIEAVAVSDDVDEEG